MSDYLSNCPVRVHGIYQTGNEEVPATFFEAWNGLISADHVIEELRGQVPLIGRFGWNPTVDRGGPAIDGALIGCDIPQERPRDPVEGELISIFGHPAGARNLERRRGKVHFKRQQAADEVYSTPRWIGYMLPCPVPAPSHGTAGADHWPIDRGFSGSPVIAEDGLIGILNAKNPPTDLVGNDGIPETPFEFISMSQIWDVMKNVSNV